MAESLGDLLVRVVNTPDPVPFRFEVGQKVKVYKSTFDDGVTDKCWMRGSGVVVARRSTMFCKTHSYTVQHVSGAVEIFAESELYAVGVRAKCPGNYYSPTCTNAASPPHSCPLAEEIHGDNSLCTCCDSCTAACRVNI